MSYAELYVSPDPGSKGLPIGWLPGFLAFEFLPFEEVKCSWEGILLPLPITIMSSLKRGLCVKGPAGSWEGSSLPFRRCRIRGPRTHRLLGLWNPRQGLAPCPCWAVHPAECVAGARERLGWNVDLDG